MADIKEYDRNEWIAEAERRFGKDIKNWRFRCPVCGHIQSIGDFEPYKVTPNTAFFSCIGRWDGHIGSKKSPCNYTLGGLFNLAKVYVIDEEGARHPVFDFDEVING